MDFKVNCIFSPLSGNGLSRAIVGMMCYSNCQGRFALCSIFERSTFTEEETFFFLVFFFLLFFFVVVCIHRLYCGSVAKSSHLRKTQLLADLCSFLLASYSGEVWRRKTEGNGKMAIVGVVAVDVESTQLFGHGIIACVKCDKGFVPQIEALNMIEW